MKLPFVSRADAEEAQAILAEELHECREDLRTARASFADTILAERERYERLVQTVVALQRDGFAPPKPAPPTVEQPRERELPTAVANALDELGLTGALRRTNEALAREWLGVEGATAHEVAAKLLAGEPIEDS